jgi:NADH:ubiquinone oxidoreductase subunit 2 (subunit N)
MGAVIISEIGKSLLAISLFLMGFPIYFGLVIIQSLALGLWSVSVSNLGLVLVDLDYGSVAGAARQWPVISSGFLVGYFSLTGLPFLAGFPLYWALGSGHSSSPLWVNAWLVLGAIGTLVGGIRALGALTLDSGEENVLILGSRFQRGIIILLNGILLILGLFPRGLLSITQRITEILVGG